jgi:hypothetical protein
MIYHYFYPLNRYEMIRDCDRDCFFYTPLIPYFGKIHNFP